jgi:hypothetical protein
LNDAVFSEWEEVLLTIGFASILEQSFVPNSPSLRKPIGFYSAAIKQRTLFQMKMGI